MADWNKIRKEYIKGGISQKAIAAKYGEKYRALTERAISEKWTAQREEVRKRTVEKSIEKTADAAASVDLKVFQAATVLLDKVIQAANELDLVEEMVSETVATDESEVTTKYSRVRQGNAGTVDRQGLRQIANALKDIKEILAVRSELDLEEQKARIEKLRRDSTPEDEDRNVTVQLMGVDDYAE